MRLRYYHVAFGVGVLAVVSGPPFIAESSLRLVSFLGGMMMMLFSATCADYETRCRAPEVVTSPAGAEGSVSNDTQEMIKND